MNTMNDKVAEAAKRIFEARAANRNHDPQNVQLLDDAGLVANEALVHRDAIVVEVSKLNLKPGDVLVLQYPAEYTQEQIDGLGECARDISDNAGVHVMVAQARVGITTVQIAGPAVGDVMAALPPAEASCWDNPPRDIKADLRALHAHAIADANGVATIREAADKLEAMTGMPVAHVVAGAAVPPETVAEAKARITAPRLTYEQRRDRYACGICGNVPDEYGHLEHGRGCYTQSADGGGDEFIDMYGELR